MAENTGFNIFLFYFNISTNIKWSMKALKKNMEQRKQFLEKGSNRKIPN